MYSEVPAAPRARRQRALHQEQLGARRAGARVRRRAPAGQHRARRLGRRARQQARTPQPHHRLIQSHVWNRWVPNTVNCLLMMMC